MKISNDTKLCFDDILLVPQFSNLKSRTEPDISTMIGDHYNNVFLKLPIISAPMDSITGPSMLSTMDDSGGLGILSRYISLSYEEELKKQRNEIAIAIKDDCKNIGCAIGIRNSLHKTQILTEMGCGVICLDVAHCDHLMAHRALEEIVSYRDSHGMRFVVMAGNICTANSTKRLIDIGVNAIKVGIGPGAVCTTRKVTGFGIPQLSAIMECYEACKDSRLAVSIIADGGIRTTGDMLKALWAGADACMIGYMLAGTVSTPDIEGKKIYRGMSSSNVSGRDDIAPEGISIEMMVTRILTSDVLASFSKGIKSGLAMGGSKTLRIFREKVSAVRITTASLKESMIHGKTSQFPFMGELINENC